MSSSDKPLSYAQRFRNNLEAVSSSKDDAELERTFETFAAPDAQIDINGRQLSSADFKEVWRRHMNRFRDAVFDWKYLFSTDEFAAPVGYYQTDTVGLYYVYYCKVQDPTTSEWVPIEYHRAGSASVDKEGKLVKIKLTMTVKGPDHLKSLQAASF